MNLRNKPKQKIKQKQIIIRTKIIIKKIKIKRIKKRIEIIIKRKRKEIQIKNR